jgi:hypothetical protein
MDKFHVFGRNTKLNHNEFIGTVDASYYSLLKRFIRVEQHNTLESDLKLLLFNHGWLSIPTSVKDKADHLDKLDLNVDTSTAGDIHRSIVNSRISVEFLSELFKAQLSQPAVFETIYLNMIQRTDIFDIKWFLSESISLLLKKDCTTEVNKFINSLWYTKSSVGGNNIGNGEICLTLLTGAVKANIGDLKLPDGSRDVEMKCTSGKLGTEYYAENTPNRLARLLNLSKDQFYINFLQTRERSYNYDQYLKLWKELRTRRELIKLKVREAEYRIYSEIAELQKNNEKVSKLLIDAKYNLKQFKYFLRDIGPNILPETGKGTGISLMEIRGLKNLYQKAKIIKNNFTNIEEYKNKKFRFDQSIREYFLNKQYNLDSQELIDGFIECRNYTLSGEQLIDLHDTIYKFFTTHPVSSLCNEKNLMKFIISLHSICYWYKKKFTDIQFINDKTKSSFILHFPDVSNIKDVFEKIYYQLPEQLETNFSLGGQNPCGVEVTLEA